MQSNMGGKWSGISRNRNRKSKREAKATVDQAVETENRSYEQDRSPCSMPTISDMPELVILHISSFLSPEDTIRLARASRFFHSILPRFVLIKGRNFEIRGPHGGHWAPERYFDSQKLTGPVRKLYTSVEWMDQGWGNRKGELFIQLIRGDVVVAEKRAIFGIAEHNWTKAKAVITDDAVSKAESGDVFRFMRNAGGGGGHQLKVKNFRALYEYLPDSQSHFE